MAHDGHDRSAFRFMARLAERGIDYAGSYLEDATGCSVRIVDPDGETLYATAGADAVFGEGACSAAPSASMCTGEAGASLGREAVCRAGGASEGASTDYDEPRRLLSVFLPLDSGEARIELAPLEPGEASHASDMIEDIALALSYHLTSYRSRRRKIGNLENDLSPRLFANGCEGLAVHLRETGQAFDEDACYVVAVTRNDHASHAPGCNWSATTEDVRRYLDEQGAFDAVDIGIDEGFVHLFPSDYALDGRSVGASGRSYDLARHKAVHDRRNGIVTSVGIGRAYPFSELEKSYREATLALELGWLSGRINAVSRYEGMGMFTLLLDMDRAAVLDRCERMLAPLVEFEALHGTPLLDTLRRMLDASFRWTEVSRLLFIHVNTLRYRMDKIGELLGEDFSLASVRSNYYFAVKLYDLLRAQRF